MEQVKFWVSGHFLENAWREWPEILHADVSLPPSERINLWLRCFIFVILVLFWLSETGQIWGFRALPGERIGRMAWNMVCCCILTTNRSIRLLLRSGEFSHFGAILTYWNGSNLGFPGIFWKTHWGNGLEFCMLMYPDHFQNRSDYGYSL